MKPHTPYHIHHVYLNQGLALPALDLVDQGIYLVFWWKEIALGDLYLQPGSSITEQEYHKLLLGAILPSLKFYSKKDEVIEVLKCTQVSQFNTWHATMDSIFLKYTSVILPDQVPVSVIVCTRNRATQLKRCLNILNGLCCVPEEIIIVDNAPTDNSTELVVSHFNSTVKIRYVKELRPGLDIARNTGLQHATYPIVAYVDDDVTVHPQWIFETWKTFQNPSISAMTGLVITSELKTEAQFIFEKYWSFNRGYTDKIYDHKFLSQTLAKGPPVWKIGAGANMAFRKEIFNKVGCFDERLDAGAAGCSGDSEMWYRILLEGKKIQYNPRAIVYHEHRKCLKELKRQIYYYMRGHASAALIQQQQHQKAGYKMHLAKLLFKKYSYSAIKGFPFYRMKHRTLREQIVGTIAGLVYYIKHQKKSSNTT